ncbi:MBL fold metallo-hydrolase [Breznakiella homolactica]|uniref:MBL fold metallo-hydrolase n=1 Tax=Breznakiella homolactica TaxID=2798577 RepID=A0A7T8B9Y9_9SPIR|nr:MBL fold metallo-hydrolase [Breznakiella homolactica]QQO08811.1 MBL fold metallo-hydrolase [Breznakiella homolactica]
MVEFKVLELKSRAGQEDVTVYPVLIINGTETLLFDAGYPAQADTIESELSRRGFSISNLTGIIISHHDHDHVGSLRALKTRNPSIKIAAHKNEAPYIDGSRTSLRLIQAEEYNMTLEGSARDFGLWFAGYLKTIEPCPVDLLLDDAAGEISPGIRVIPTPGHTPGHISLWLYESGTILTGDALAFEGGRLTVPNPEFTLDMKKSLASVETIRALSPRTIVCYHGGTVRENIPGLLEAAAMGKTE